MNKKLKWLIILVPVIVIVLFLLVAALIPNKDARKEKIVPKEFKTKDERVTFTASDKFKSLEKGDFDLYLNKDNKQIMGVFSYNLNEYEENTSKQILDKQVNYYVTTRKDMKIWKKENKIDMEDKVITKVEYTGKTDKSTDCIYIFSVIDFKADSNYTLYINEVISKDSYEKNIGEMNNILKSAKLN